MKNLDIKPKDHTEGMALESPDSAVHTTSARLGIWRRIFTWQSLSVLLIATILLSMLSWGLGDIFSKQESNFVIEIAGKAITKKDLERAINRFKNIWAQSKDVAQLPDDAIRATVLREEINKIVLIKEMTQIGFVISDQDMTDYILKMNETLVDEHGQLNIRLIKGILQSNNISEREFFDSVRLDIFVKKILGIVEHGAVSPMGIAEKIASSRQQQRIFDLLVVKKSDKGTPPPSEVEIEKFYQEHIKDFMRPTSHKITYLDGDDLVKRSNMLVTAKQIQERYDQIYQQSNHIFTVAILIFDSIEKAQGLKNNIKVTFKNSLLAAATSLGKAKSEVLLEKVELFQFKPEIRQVVERMHINQISDVIDLDGKFAIIQLLKIGKNKMLRNKEEVDKIKKDLAQNLKKEQACITLQDVRTKIEYGLTHNVPLNIIAQNLGLTLHQANVEDGHALFDAARKQGETGLSVASHQECSFAVVKVDEIIPQKLLPMVEVRHRVALAAHRYKDNLAMRQISTSVFEQLKTTGSDAGNLKKVISGRNIKLIHNLSLTRENIENTGLGKNMEHTLFTLDPHQLAGPFLDIDGKYGEKGAYIIAILRSISNIEPNNPMLREDATVIHNDILQQKKNDILELYMNHLYKKYHVGKLSGYAS